MKKKSRYLDLQLVCQIFCINVRHSFPISFNEVIKELIFSNVSTKAKFTFLFSRVDFLNLNSTFYRNSDKFPWPQSYLDWIEKERSDAKIRCADMFVLSYCWKREFPDDYSHYV